MTPSDQIRETFFQECEELLEALLDGLQAIGDRTADDETINGVFRAVHSIKGGAGAFGFQHLVDFAHEFETALDATRNDRLTPDDTVIAVFQSASDMLGDLVQAAYEGGDVDSALTRRLIGELKGLLGLSPAAVPPDDDAAPKVVFQPVAMALDLDDDDENMALQPQSGEAQQDFTIRFRPHRLLYRNGNETVLILRALAALGTLEVTCDRQRLPGLDTLDPEESYLEWVLFLSTPDGETAVQDVFEFVEGVCDLEISAGRASNTAGARAPAGHPFGAVPGGDSRLPASPVPQSGTDADAPPHLTDPGTEAGDVPSARSLAQTDQAVGPPNPVATVATTTGATPPARGPAASVRVDVARVDRLINLVGELVMNQAMLAQCINDQGTASLADFSAGLDDFKHLSREIQDSVMAIRTQPVKPLFRRMFRIVREAAAATGKSVRLDVSGDMTEVDKTVIEKLADPLTHMIRNAVDHGLEQPDAREAAGKPRQGVIRLSAAHRSGRVIIDISDDGDGIDRARVRQIALDRGLIDANQTLSPEETDALLFRPGFSTAKEVSNLSGRGVGLDVVKNAIRTLSGRVSVASVPGKGSTFSISLPLTLAVLDGMVVEAALQRAVIPIGAIVETLSADINHMHRVGAMKVVAVRDGVVPVIDVAQTLGFRDELQDLEGRILILVKNDDGALCALCVDRILDQRQVVIKGLEENYGHVAGVSAATILGDGGIALILDMDHELFVGRGARECAEPALARTG